MHKLGYIHRDVKPHNFVTGRKNKTKIYVIDFGLARKYLSPDGEHRPPRNLPGFKGTARYASLNSHKLAELSRRDDLISIFYMLVEFYKGSLPWAGLGDKQKKIAELKEKHTNEELLQDFPKEFCTMMEHIMKLNYYDDPDYGLLKNLLLKIVKDNEFNLEESFDWDRTTTQNQNQDNLVLLNGTSFSNLVRGNSGKNINKVNNSEKNETVENSSTKEVPTSSSRINFEGKNENILFQEVKRNSFEVKKKIMEKNLMKILQKLEPKNPRKGCCIVS